MDDAELREAGLTPGTSGWFATKEVACPRCQMPAGTCCTGEGIGVARMPGGVLSHTHDERVYARDEQRGIVQRRIGQRLVNCVLCGANGDASHHNDGCKYKSAFVNRTRFPCPSCTVPPGCFHDEDCVCLVPAVNDHIRPKHYGGPDDPYEPLKVMLAQHGKDAVVSFCWLTAEKYLARAGKKPGEPIERDFRKAAFYLTHAAELLEAK